MDRDQVEDQLCAAFRAQDWTRAYQLEQTLDALDRPRSPATLLGAALWYAEQGLPVFPCQPGRKIPYARTKGVLDATTDPARIRQWWAAAPASNVAVATGHLVDVVDFDGALAHVAWARLLGDRADLVPGAQLLATVSTPRAGGMHAYIATRGHGNRAAMVPGVDYRGLGGYVLAPPSVTEAGAYAFLRPFRPGLAQWT